MSEPHEGADEEEAGEVPPMPFSFKLVVVLGGAYLVYRVVQLLMCIPSLIEGTNCPFL